MPRNLFGLVTTLLAAISSCSANRPKEAPPTRVALSLAGRMNAQVHRNPRFAYAVPYRLYSPPKRTTGQRYPLLVYLHGGGDSGSDNLRQLNDDVARFLAPEIQSLEPFFVLAPQCPNGDEWINRRARPPFKPYDQSKFPESDAAKATLEIIQALFSAEPIDPDRVYLTGVSMGGSGTWDFITRHPGIVAAAIPVTGVGDPSRAEVVAHLPIWAFHGTLDEISPIENSRAMSRALYAVGAKAKFTEFEGVGHDSWTRAYSQRETFVWLFEQRRGAR